ncbi:MAG: hypothetical protein A2137_02770 [Chloroflexi bacterium RBG_16_58_8]|nr:MAG: hypothetical protein A2137_02770 [Chloroflexi bacterium RBG_16_58_8]
MDATRDDLEELIGEHEAIMAYMRFLAKSLDGLAAQSICPKERVWSYCWGLNDFRDAIKRHLEVDERILKALPGDASEEDPLQEHREIQELVDDMIKVADISIVDKLRTEDLNQYAVKIGVAFNRIFKLIEMHIARENVILAHVKKAMNNSEAKKRPPALRNQPGNKAD